MLETREQIVAANKEQATLTNKEIAMAIRQKMAQRALNDRLVIRELEQIRRTITELTCSRSRLFDSRAKINQLVNDSFLHKHSYYFDANISFAISLIDGAVDSCKYVSERLEAFKKCIDIVKKEEAK